VIAGVVVLAWPFSSVVVLAVVVGAWLVALGIVQIVAALSVRRDVETIAKNLPGTFDGSSAVAA